MSVRSIIALAVASATFGGVVGALATAATDSQASPAAIAAAVRVQDAAAEHSLQAIKSDLAMLNGMLGSHGAIGAELHDTCVSSEQTASNTSGEPFGPPVGSCEPPLSLARRAHR